MRVFTSDQLDYRALITYLSQHISFPCPLHIRNQLLAPYTAHPAHPVLDAHLGVDEDPWRTWHDYRRGASIAAIGAVPNRVMARQCKEEGGDDNNEEDEDKDDDKNNGGGKAEVEDLWALVLVSSDYAPGWVEPRADEVIQDSMRFSMWLSTERPLDTTKASSQTRSATDKEVNLLRFICTQHIPACMVRLAAVVPTSRQSMPLPRYRDVADANSLDVADFAVITIFSVYHSWVEVMKSRLHDDDNDGRACISTGAATGCDVRVVHTNPCTTFVMTEQQASAMAADVDRRTQFSNWHIAPIDDSEGTARMIIESNNIAFPFWYLRHRRHISVLVHDTEPSSGDGVVSYPTQRQAGAPAGWAYAHDYCAIASLHVTHPYRRLTNSNWSDGGDKSDPIVSVGRVCVAKMAVQLVAAQKHALAKAGCATAAAAATSLPTPLLSAAERHKDVAVAFHEKVGFVPSTFSTWGTLAVRLPVSS